VGLTRVALLVGNGREAVAMMVVWEEAVFQGAWWR